MPHPVETTLAFYLQFLELGIFYHFFVPIIICCYCSSIFVFKIIWINYSFGCHPTSSSNIFWLYSFFNNSFRIFRALKPVILSVYMTIQITVCFIIHYKFVQKIFIFIYKTFNLFAYANLSAVSTSFIICVN